MSRILHFGLFLLLSFTWNSAAAQTPLQLLIPAYGNPCCDTGKILWDNLLSTAKNSRIPLHIIFNPASGAGTSRDPNYLNAQGAGMLAEVHKSNAVIYAYISSQYAQKPLEEIKIELERYFEQYYRGVIDGVFIDEMSNDLNDVGYYQALYRYIKQQYNNAPIIGNPGTSYIKNSHKQSRYSREDYANSVDIMVTFENKQSEYTSINHPSRGAIAHIIHSATEWSPQLAQAILDNHVDYIYITADTSPNPYDSLSHYWTQLRALIAH